MADFKHLLAEAHRRAWYRWSDAHPGQHWHPGNKGYYYGMFWSDMPDLNYLNHDVTEEVKNMRTFWLQDVGVDGFRIDAAQPLRILPGQWVDFKPLPVMDAYQMLVLKIK